MSSQRGRTLNFLPSIVWGVGDGFTNHFWTLHFKFQALKTHLSNDSNKNETEDVQSSHLQDATPHA